MKAEGTDNGLASSNTGPWKTVRMMFYLQKYCNPGIPQQNSKMKNCLCAFSILSSRRAPVKPASKFTNRKKEVMCSSDIISQLCYPLTVIIHVLVTAGDPVRNHSPISLNPAFSWNFLPSQFTSRLSLFR